MGEVFSGEAPGPSPLVPGEMVWGRSYQRQKPSPSSEDCVSLGTLPGDTHTDTHTHTQAPRNGPTCRTPGTLAARDGVGDQNSDGSRRMGGLRGGEVPSPLGYSRSSEEPD